MLTALWAAEIGYLMWGVGGCLPGQGEGHGQAAMWLGIEWRWDLGNSKPGNYEKKLLQDFVMLMSYFSDQIHSVTLANPDDESIFYCQCQHRAMLETTRQREKCWDNLVERAAQPKLLACFVLFFEFLKRIRKGWQISPEVKHNHRDLRLWIKGFRELARINVSLFSLSFLYLRTKLCGISAETLKFSCLDSVILENLFCRTVHPREGN